ASEPDQSGDESVEEEDDDGYSSLLELHNPFAAPKGESVRIEEPEPEDETPRPAVIFPGQGEPSRGVATDGSGSRPFDPPGKSAAPAAPAPHAAEQAAAGLRAALATLQRMSGAA